MKNLRQALQSGETVVGTFCELPAPAAVEIIAHAGWQFAVVDCEHAPLTAHQLPDFIRAGDSAGMPVIVRTPENNPAAIQHALDSGAAGVLVPQVASIEAAASAARSSRFHPLGARGLNPFVRAARYSALSTADFCRMGNEDVLCILQIESSAALDDVDRIAELPGVDVLFAGPYDLSQSLGIPGQVSDSRVLGAGERIASAARRYGKALGVFVNHPEQARLWAAAGARFISYTVDTVQLLAALRSSLDLLRKSLAQSRI